jgi:hypothetical protein
MPNRHKSFANPPGLWRNRPIFPFGPGRKACHAHSHISFNHSGASLVRHKRSCSRRGFTPALPTADISVEASRPAPNDQFRAQVDYETNEASPSELARKVNTVIIAQALQTARTYPTVKVRTGASLTYPVYGKNVRSIEAWRMRSTLALEAQDAAASELLGKLQQSMVIAASMQPLLRDLEEDRGSDHRCPRGIRSPCKAGCNRPQQKVENQARFNQFRRDPAKPSCRSPVVAPT